MSIEGSVAVECACSESNAVKKQMGVRHVRT